jgi:hypothetical protein
VVAAEGGGSEEGTERGRHLPASSMEWVVSRIARVRFASRMHPHSVRRDAGSSPVLGSSCEFGGGWMS